MKIFLLLKGNTFLSTISWETRDKYRWNYPPPSKKIEFWGSKSKRLYTIEVMLLEVTGSFIRQSSVLGQLDIWKIFFNIIL